MSLLNPQDLIEKFNHEIESDAIYTSTTGNVHSLYAALVSKTVENAYISKVGDIPNEDTHYKGSNSAVYAENNGKYIVENSSIKTDALGADATAAFNAGEIEVNNTDILVLNNLSAGILASNNSTSAVDNVSLYTLGENSNAVYIYGNSSAYIENSYIGTEQSAIAHIEGEGRLYIGSTYIFNSGNEYIVEAVDNGANNVNVNINDVIFDVMATPLVSIKGTNTSSYNTIKFTDTAFLSPEEDAYSFVLENSKTEIILEESSSDTGLGNLLNAINSTVDIDATNSNLSGHVVADDDSIVNITIGQKKVFTGSVNGKNAKVKLTKATWNLTADTSIAELDIDYTSTINKNNHLLLVDGEDYTDGIEVGSVVHYTTKAEKVYDRVVLERNCIVIKKLVNSEGANEFILYDADDHLAYKALYSEFRNTGKRVDITPLLDDIEDLLIDIDTYYSDSTIRTKDENTNAVIIDDKTYILSNVVVEKYNDAADEARGLNGENAAVLVTNEGELNLEDSTIISDGNYAPGIMVDKSSRVSLDNVSINTQDNNSPGIKATTDSEVTADSCNISTIGENSPAIKVLNGAEVDTSDCTLSATGNSDTVYISNIGEGDYTPTTNNTNFYDQNSTFASEGTHIIKAYAEDTIEDTEINIKLKGSKINEDENNSTITSLIKCSGKNTADTINIILDAAEFINPPESSAFLHVDPCTVNLTLDNASTFTQLNNSGYLFRVDNDSILNITATGATIAGQIRLEPTAEVNLNMYSCIFNGVFNPAIESGTVNVKMVNSTWNMSSDDYIHSLDMDTDSTINTNGFTLYIDGKIYNPVTDINDQYEEIEVPTGRVLKVLTANEYSELTTKSESYIYFLYDKLEMWFEHSKFVSPFCIIEKLPEDTSTMVADILYIDYTTGKLYIYNDYSVKEVGYVEHGSDGKSDPEQLSILSAAGTTYFHNAESRYIDVQTRTIILPYQNGSYQICVNIPEDLKIDENTVVYYNPETEQWEVDGYRTSSEFEIPYYNNIKPANSATVFTDVIDKHIIRSELRISNKEDNLIDTTVNGIYVDGSNLASKSEYYTLKDAILQYRAIADSYMIELRDAITKTVGAVSMDVINEKIMTALNNYESTIDTMVEDYAAIYDRLIAVEESSDAKVQEKLDNAKQEILDYLDGLANPWQLFTEDVEIPSLTPEEKRHIAAALEYGRQKIMEVANGYPVKYVESLPLTDQEENTIYAVWDSDQEFYRISIWNPVNENWDPWDNGVTPVMPEEEEDLYYRNMNVASVDTVHNTILTYQDAVEGFVYNDTSTGKRYLFTGSTFIELTD